MTEEQTEDRPGDGIRPGPAAIVAMMSGACSIGLVFVVLPPILHQLADHLGGDADAAFGVQMMAAMPGIGLVLGGLVASWTIDRLGARALLNYALIAYMILGSAGLYIDNLTGLCVTRLLLGLATAGIATASNTLIAHFYGGAARGRMISAATVVGSMLCVVAMLASGEIAEIAGWRAPFAIYIAAPMILWLAAIFGIPRIAIRSEGSSSEEKGSTGVVIAKLWPYYLLITSLYVVLMMTSTQVSFLLAENGIIRPVIQARVLGTASFFLILGALLYGWVQGRYGANAAFRLGLLTLGIGIIGFGLAHDAVTASIAAASKGLASGLLNSGFIHMIMNRSEPHLRGRALGIMTSAMFLGDFLNPIVVHPIKEMLSLHAAFHVLGTLVLAGLLWSLLKRSRPAEPAVAG
jgi:MFS family permease